LRCFEIISWDKNAKVNPEKCIQRFWWGDLKERATRGPRHGWDDNIKMHLQEVEWRGIDWIYVVQNRDRWWVLVNAIMWGVS
jgi:hypothetical protein